MKVRFGISIEEEIVKALDKAIAEKKRFANRSQAIEYCVKMALELEDYEPRYIEYLIDFLEIVEKHPDARKNFEEFLEMKKKEEEIK